MKETAAFVPMIGRTVSVTKKDETMISSKVVIVAPPFTLDSEELSKALSHKYTIIQSFSETPDSSGVI